MENKKKSWFAAVLFEWEVVVFLVLVGSGSKY